MTGDVQTTTLGTSELTKNKIQIFPNPVTDLISIRGIDDGTSIQIYTIDGRLVKSEMFDSKIDVSQLAPGGYVLKINTRNFQTHQFKFVKKIRYFFLNNQLLKLSGSPEAFYFKIRNVFA